MEGEERATEITRAEIPEKSEKFHLHARFREHTKYELEKESRTTNQPTKYWKEKGTRP